MLENKVLRRVFGPKREEVMGGWRGLHNEELHSLYIAPNIIQMMKSERMRWVGHVAHMGEMRNAYKIWLEDLTGRGHLEDTDVDGRIVSEWILGK
jgi:hypothetical protein